MTNINILGEKNRTRVSKIDFGLADELNKFYSNPNNLEKKAEKEQSQPEIQPANNQTAPNKSGMIYVPNAGIYFAKERTHLGKNWFEAHESLASEGLRMPTIEEFRRSLAYFKNSNEKELKELYNEITEVRAPWRANWIDAYFQKESKLIRKDEYFILTGNKTKKEKLEDCFMEDKALGISLDDWVEGKNVTKQGLPTNKMKDGDLYYWHPVEDKVARFSAGDDRAGLFCYWYPSSRVDDLGVFAVADTDPNARQ